MVFGLLLFVFFFSISAWVSLSYVYSITVFFAYFVVVVIMKYTWIRLQQSVLQTIRSLFGSFTSTKFLSNNRLQLLFVFYYMTIWLTAHSCCWQCINIWIILWFNDCRHYYVQITIYCLIQLNKWNSMVNFFRRF